MNDLENRFAFNGLGKQFYVIQSMTRQQVAKIKTEIIKLFKAIPLSKIVGFSIMNDFS